MNSRNRKRNSSKPKCFDLEEFDDDYTARTLAVRNRSVIKGKIISGFGGGKMDELVVLFQAQGWTELLLQGPHGRKMGRVKPENFITIKQGLRLHFRAWFLAHL